MRAAFLCSGTPYRCVSACVRMVLAGLGHVLPEAAIRTRCGHSKLGLRLSQIGGGLVDLPVDVEYHNDWSMDDVGEFLRRSTYPIVGIDLRPIDGVFAFHAVVLLSVSGGGVVVHDPNQGTRTIGLSRSRWRGMKRSERRSPSARGLQFEFDARGHRWRIDAMSARSDECKCEFQRCSQELNSGGRGSDGTECLRL